MKKILAGIAVVAVVAGSAAGGWFAHERYLEYLDGPTPEVPYVDPNVGPHPETGPSLVPDGSDTRPIEDLPKCADLDPKYLAWLDSVHIMRPRCQ